MKSKIQIFALSAGLFFLFSCAQQSTKPDETAGLKDQLSAKDKQIDALNEKIASLSSQLSNQPKGSDASSYSNLIKDLQDQLAAKESTITALQNSVKVTFLSDIFFDEGSDVIKPEGKKALDDIVKTLVPINDRLIRVEGYTDDVPIATAYQWKFPSNWELSTARADAVVRYLVEKGIKPDMIKSAGYGKFNPVASNATPEGKAQNRRIEVQLVPLDTRAKFK